MVQAELNAYIHVMGPHPCLQCSDFVVADISFRSLQIMFIFIIKVKRVRSKHPKYVKFNFENKITAAVSVAY